MRIQPKKGNFVLPQAQSSYGIPKISPKHMALCPMYQTLDSFSWSLKIGSKLYRNLEPSLVLHWSHHWSHLVHLSPRPLFHVQVPMYCHIYYWETKISWIRSNKRILIGNLPELKESPSILKERNFELRDYSIVFSPSFITKKTFFICMTIPIWFMVLTTIG